MTHAEILYPSGARRSVLCPARIFAEHRSIGPTRGEPSADPARSFVLPQHCRRHAGNRGYGHLQRAKSRIKGLETAWDRAEPKLRPRSPEQWRKIDKAIDAALQQLRADSPQAAAAKEALQNLLAELDQPNESATVAPGKAEAAHSIRLSIADIIAALEKLRADESVLDVSFEPKDGQPAYAVRTYANGKVWDGLLDGTSGAEIDHGTVMDESALD